MSTTTTQNYGLVKPTPGTERDTWGQELNGNFDSIDGLIKTNADAISLNTTLDNLPVTQSTDYKESARVRSSVNVVLTAPGATVDSVTMAVNDRFLATAQTTVSQNGIYVWNGAAVPATRSTDADVSSEVSSGMVVPVDEGTSASTLWLLSTPNPINLGTTSLTFIQVTAASGVKTNLNVNTFPLTINNTHRSRRLHIINGAANVVINLGNVMNLNDEFEVFVDGTGTATFVGTGGVTIQAAYGLVIGRQYGWVQLKKFSTTLWQLYGNTFSASSAGAQPLDATLTALSGLATSANQLILATGADAFSMIAATPLAQSLLNDTTQAEMQATIGAAASTPSWVPEGASVYSDFVNGLYWANGAERTVSEVWIEDINWLTFNPALDIDSGGFGARPAHGPVLSSLAKATLNLEGMSVVFDLTTAANSSPFQTETLDLPSYNSELQFYFNGSIGGFEPDTMVELPDNVAVNGDPLTAVRRKVAFTCGLTSAKMVSRGGTVYNMNFTARVPSPSDFALSSNGTWISSRIHSVTIYNSILSDFQLQSLTITSLVTTDLGVTVQGFNADILKSNVNANLTVGFTSTAFNAGSKTTGTFTPDPGLGNLQKVTNDGAHTLAPPSLGSGTALTMVLNYTNGATAGAITTSGFTKVTGDAYTTVNAQRFMFYISVIETASHLNIVALQ